MQQLDEALFAKGYYHPPSRTKATKNTIRTIFTKTGWSSREVKAVLTKSLPRWSVRRAVAANSRIFEIVP